jgi:ketosteroid isomerase-like protein
MMSTLWLLVAVAVIDATQPAHAQTTGLGAANMKAIAGLRPTKTDGRDAVAYVQGTFSMTLGPQGGAAPDQASGYFVQVLRRQGNGTWQIAVQMLSLH